MGHDSSIPVTVTVELDRDLMGRVGCYMGHDSSVPVTVTVELDPDLMGRVGCYMGHDSSIPVTVTVELVRVRVRIRGRVKREV